MPAAPSLRDVPRGRASLQPRCVCEPTGSQGDGRRGGPVQAGSPTPEVVTPKLPSGNGGAATTTHYTPSFSTPVRPGLSGGLCASSVHNNRFLPGPPRTAAGLGSQHLDGFQPEENKPVPKGCGSQEAPLTRGPQQPGGSCYFPGEDA